MKSQKLQIEIVTLGLLRSKRGPTGTWTAQELVPDFITVTIHHKHITNDQDSDFWLYLHKNYDYSERNKSLFPFLTAERLLFLCEESKPWSKTVTVFFFCLVFFAFFFSFG